MEGREPVHTDACAVKLLRALADESDRKDFERECEIMSQFKHLNLISLLGVSFQQRPWLCVIEYCVYGDVKMVLQTLSKQCAEITPSEGSVLMKQIADGMAHLAERGFVHRDLAARNVLLHEDNLVKVADFGLTQPIDPEKGYYLMRNTQKVPLPWAPPDVATTKKFSTWTDVWGYGVCCVEIFNMGQYPYHELRERMKAKASADQKRYSPMMIIDAIKDGYRIPKEKRCPDEIWDLINRCWHDNAESRPDFSTISQCLKEITKIWMLESPPRDLGKLMNGELSAMVRRATMAVTIRRASRIEQVKPAPIDLLSAEQKKEPVEIGNCKRDTLDSLIHTGVSSPLNKFDTLDTLIHEDNRTAGVEKMDTLDRYIEVPEKGSPRGKDLGPFSSGHDSEGEKESFKFNVLEEQGGESRDRTNTADFGFGFNVSEEQGEVSRDRTNTGISDGTLNIGFGSISNDRSPSYDV